MGTSYCGNNAFKSYIPSCTGAVIFNINLLANTDYTWCITDVFGNTYEVPFTSSNEGSGTLLATDLPSGLLVSGSNGITVKVKDANGLFVPVLIADNYNTIEIIVLGSGTCTDAIIPSGEVGAPVVIGSYDEILEGQYINGTTFNDLSGDPFTPDLNKYYVDVVTDSTKPKVYKWTGSAYVTLDVGAEPAFSKNTAFNKNFGNTAGTVMEGNFFTVQQNGLTLLQSDPALYPVDKPIYLKDLGAVVVSNGTSWVFAETEINSNGFIRFEPPNDTIEATVTSMTVPTIYAAFRDQTSIGYNNKIVTHAAETIASNDSRIAALTGTLPVGGKKLLFMSLTRTNQIAITDTKPARTDDNMVLIADFFVINNGGTIEYYFIGSQFDIVVYPWLALTTVTERYDLSAMKLTGFAPTLDTITSGVATVNIPSYTVRLEGLNYSNWLAPHTKSVIRTTATQQQTIWNTNPIQGVITPTPGQTTINGNEYWNTTTNAFASINANRYGIILFVVNYYWDAAGQSNGLVYTIPFQHNGVGQVGYQSLQDARNDLDRYINSVQLPAGFDVFEKATAMIVKHGTSLTTDVYIQQLNTGGASTSQVLDVPLTDMLPTVSTLAAVQGYSVNTANKIYYNKIIYSRVQNPSPIPTGAIQSTVDNTYYWVHDNNQKMSIFTILPALEWDITTQPKATKTITGAATIIVTCIASDEGMLVVKGDGNPITITNGDTFTETIFCKQGVNTETTIVLIADGVNEFLMYHDGITPTATPVMTADDTANTLVITASEGNLFVSENNGAYTLQVSPYNINVGNVARAAAYWKAKASLNGVDSAVVESPAFNISELILTAPSGLVGTLPNNWVPPDNEFRSETNAVTQNGNVNKIRMKIGTGTVTKLWINIWNGNTRVGQHVVTSGFIANDVNEFILPSPIAVQTGYKYSVGFNGSGNVVELFTATNGNKGVSGVANENVLGTTWDWVNNSTPGNYDLRIQLIEA